MPSGSAREFALEMSGCRVLGGGCAEAVGGAGGDALGRAVAGRGVPGWAGPTMTRMRDLGEGTTGDMQPTSTIRPWLSRASAFAQNHAPRVPTVSSSVREPSHSARNDGSVFESPQSALFGGSEVPAHAVSTCQDPRPLSVLAGLHHAHRWASRLPAVPRLTGIRQTNGREP